MTEQEWFVCTRSARMLSWLLGDIGQPGYKPEKKPSDRKLRLFVDACREHFYVSAYNGGTESRWKGDARLREKIPYPIASARNWAQELSQNPLRAGFLRCIFGNPFYKPKPKLGSRLQFRSGSRLFDMPLHLLSWNDGAITKIARNIYDNQSFGDLPILADALEEAGCPEDEGCQVCNGRMVRPLTAKEAGALQGFYGSCWDCNGTGRVPNPILAHCRGPGPHVRGCWVVDLMLGKE